MIQCGCKVIVNEEQFTSTMLLWFDEIAKPVLDYLLVNQLHIPLNKTTN